MQRSAPSPQRSFRLAGIAILAVGWIAAALVYFTASGTFESAPDSAADYQLINGQVVRLPISASKREQQELARLGGAASVHIVEFDSWFGSFWHGERLAWTLAGGSALIALGCFYLAGLAGEDVGE
jgi:hypothetical protein